MQVKRSKFNQVKYERQEIQQVDPSQFKTWLEYGVNKEKSQRREKIMYQAIHPDKMWKV
jgi:hypothetical protein